jgi:5-methylcytosine-specific restriction enzyme subunit McrC
MTVAALPEAPLPLGAKSPAVPIRNLWHMLLYASTLAVVDNHWLAAIEDAPTLDALFARILIQGVQQQMRRGLGRSYKTQSQTIRGIRGRIDFAASVKRLTFPNGQAHCCFDEFAVNVPRNQIIRSTLAMLARDGDFGADRRGTEELKHSLRRLVGDLDGIDLVENVPSLIGRQQLSRNDGDYQIMLNICGLVWRCHMPTETSGGKAMTDLNRSAMTLHRVYEKFVTNFYRARLSGWKVASQVPMSWHAELGSPLLPGLRPDLCFQHRATGRLVVLDTKFTPNSLVRTPTEKDVFDSGHLYQLYAYLRSQEHITPLHRSASGILLYPTVHHELNETVILQGHRIRILTVDLAQPWRDIEDRLLSLFSNETGMPADVVSL